MFGIMDGGLAVVPMLAAFGPWDWVVVGFYLALMVYIGVFAAKKDQGAEEYFLADRSMPTWAVAVSVVATSLSAATFVGVPDLSYKNDLSYLVLNIGGCVSVLVVATLFVPKLYRAGTVTIYGYLQQRYGETARIAVSVMFLLGRTLASGTRLFIAAIPLCLLLFAARDQNDFAPSTGQIVLAICLIGVIGTFYTMFGGIRTVIWIDCIQFFIVVGTCLLSIGLLLHKIPGGWNDIYAALSDPSSGPRGSKLHWFDTSWTPTLKFTLWTALFGTTFVDMAAYGVDQDLAQRFLVAKSTVRGGLSLLWAKLISMVTVCFFMGIGLLLYVFYKRPDVMGAALPASAPDKHAAYPTFILNELPPVLSGVAIAGFFAIAQGSMDSAMNALASSLVADVYFPIRRRLNLPINEKSPILPKVSVALMGSLMVLFAIVSSFLLAGDQTLIDLALGVLTFFFAGMLGVFLCALLTRRGNSTSVILALVGGVSTVVLLQPALSQKWGMLLFNTSIKLAEMWWMPIGTLVSFLLCVSGSPRAIAVVQQADAKPASAPQEIEA